MSTKLILVDGYGRALFSGQVARLSWAGKGHRKGGERDISWLATGPGGGLPSLGELKPCY